MTDATSSPSPSEPSNDGETLGGARPDPSTTASKDPEQWVTGDEPMTGPQRSYLDTLAREAGEELSADLTKAEASEHIDRLQHQTGRGTPDGEASDSGTIGATS
ncbi:DUF3072 domain-containing protein [Curtobacterium sp. MMLR14_010]|uniref:DUF3072 domain-containing protein n=1 Tax=Curtobacterium sp. MMLR14_010 TaxID=1898743 RepID=UPI0008DDA417|nr:DUF3072 domain-containing protein [Curtobacterium sp. MMLR14_010]OII37765.1 DUF3072 domain-containing protein [Curtobacterium sp. MMLR14_010]